MRTTDHDTKRALFLSRTHIHDKDVGAIASLYMRLWQNLAKIERDKGQTERIRLKALREQLQEENQVLRDRVDDLQVLCDAQVAAIKQVWSERDGAREALRIEVENSNAAVAKKAEDIRELQGILGRLYKRVADQKAIIDRVREAYNEPDQ